MSQVPWIWGEAAGWPAPTEPCPSNVVHALGVPRSGSTLLRVMLAGHSALFSPPELMLLEFYAMGERRDLLETHDYGWARRGLVDAMTELLGSEAGALSEISAWEDGNVPVLEVFRRMQELCAPRRLVNKTPSDVARLETLQYADRMFDGARYVHLVRHPCAVIESFVRMNLQGLMGKNLGLWDDDPQRMGSEMWAAWNENAMVFGESVGDRYLRVAYESLVGDPRTTMTQICEFLQLPFEEALVQPYEGDRGTVGAGGNAALGDWNLASHKKIDAGEAEKWRTSGTIALTDHAREIAAQLGYTIEK